MAETEYAEFAELAARLGTEATGIALANFGSASQSLKPDQTIVTDIDHAIQAHILAAIADSYPSHSVIAEETIRRPAAHADPRAARYCWVVDPLDGTRNYAGGFACFATSIAVLDRGMPVAAAVVEHNIRAVYTAVSGRGTFLNGKRIRVVDPPPDGDCLIGVPSSKDALSVRAVREWSATRGLICRNLGSAAYHLALAACGAFAAAFCKQCKIWDIAAGVLLVGEAGGLATDERGDAVVPFRMDSNPTQDIPTLAGAPLIHDRLRRTLT